MHGTCSLFPLLCTVQIDSYIIEIKKKKSISIHSLQLFHFIYIIVFSLQSEEQCQCHPEAEGCLLPSFSGSLLQAGIDTSAIT